MEAIEHPGPSGQLFDIAAANADVRERLKVEAASKYADVCGASSLEGFRYAAACYMQVVADIDRMGRCLGCGHPLVGETVCVQCGRDNR